MNKCRQLNRDNNMGASIIHVSKFAILAAYPSISYIRDVYK